MIKRVTGLSRLANCELTLIAGVGFLLCLAYYSFLGFLHGNIASCERVQAYKAGNFSVKANPDAHELIISKKIKRGKNSKPIHIEKDVGKTVFSPLGYSLIPCLIFACILACFLMKWMSWKLQLRDRDIYIMPTVLLLLGLGLIILTRLAIDIPHVSVSRFPEALGWPFRQMIASCIAFLLIPVTALLATLMERKQWFQDIMRARFFSCIPVYMFLPVLACALMLFTFLSGKPTSGHNLSVMIGGFNLQVVEFVKPVLILFMAYILSDMEDMKKVHKRTAGISLTILSSCHMIAVFLSAFCISIFAYYCTKDIGLLLICVGFIMVVVFVGSGEISIFISGIFVIGFASLSVVYLKWPVHAFERIMGLLVPFKVGESFARARWSIASGGLLGTGPGKGMPHNVPVADSDFILAAVAEEMGLVGVSVILISLGCLLYRGFLIARREEDPFRKHLAAGIVVMLMIQTVVIAGGSLGLLPLTGIPLPFVSRGGMNTIVNAMMIGLLLQVSFFYKPKEAAVIRPYSGRWEAVNKRMRYAAIVSFALMILLGLRAGCLMIVLADKDFNRHFEDSFKIEIVSHFIEHRVLVPRGNRPLFLPECLKSAVSSLPPHLQKRVSLKHSSLDGHDIKRYLERYLEVENGVVVIPPGTFNISNPRLCRHIPFDIVDRLGNQLACTSSKGRQYPQGSTAFPVTGHSRLGPPLFLEADMGDFIQDLLRGKPGFEVGCMQLKERFFALSQGDLPNLTGQEKICVRTTVDLNVQKAAMDALGNRNGAVVVIAVPEGDIIALASKPAFNPAQALDRKKWNKAFTNRALNLKRNRALHVLYPPGSLMKLVTGAAMLEYTDLADKPVNYVYYDKKLDVKDMCKLRGRKLGFNRAMANSSNVYFVRMGVKLGPCLLNMAERLGFGKEVPLVPWLENSQMTAVPSHMFTYHSVRGIKNIPEEYKSEPPWSTKLVSEQFLKHNPKLVARAAFGQTVVEATPLQMAMVTAAIACGGKMPVLRLIRSIERVGDENGLETLFEISRSSRRVFSKSTAKRLTEAMEEVYSSGTAGKKTVKLRLAKQKGKYVLLNNPSRPVRVAAKTGSAEIANADSHAWFTAFAPAEKPRVAVVVLIENGRSGGRVAGPVGMKILRSALRAIGDHKQNDKSYRLQAIKDLVTEKIKNEGQKFWPFVQESWLSVSNIIDKLCQ